MDYDDIFNPKKSAESLGASLLERAQSNTQQRRRNRNPSGGDTLKAFGAQLAGHFAGEFFRGRMDNELQKHLHTENELQRRALVRTSVSDANNVLETNRMALQHAGGLKGYLQEQRTASNLAYLQSHYAGKPISATAMQALAVKEAQEGLEDAEKAFRKRVTLAEKLQSVSGGDPLSYTKAVREAAGTDEALGIRAVRRMFSHFKDSDDKNIDGALYRSTTTSRIYSASEEYRNAFDNLYVQTASAEAANNITEALKETGDLPLTTHDPKPVSLTTTDEFGETRTETWMQFYTPTGTTESYVNSQGVRVSPEAWKGGKLDRQNDGNRMPIKRALVVFADASESVSADVYNQLREVVNAKLPRRGATSDAINNQQAVIGEQLYLTNKSVSALFDDTLNDKKAMEIAVRSQLLDRNHFDGRPTLLSGNRKENALVTWQATIESYDGDWDDVPPAIQETLGAHIKNMVTEIPNMSIARLREVTDFADSSRLFHKATDFRFKDTTTGQSLTIQEFLNLTLRTNS